MAGCLAKRLKARNLGVVVLDGDELRAALDSFQYDIDSRKALARIYGRLALTFSRQGLVVICATVSMFHDIQSWNRENIPEYFEVYIKIPHSLREVRDKKQLIADARADRAQHVHGLDLQIEEPQNPDFMFTNKFTDPPEAIARKIQEKIGL